MNRWAKLSKLLLDELLLNFKGGSARGDFPARVFRCVVPGVTLGCGVTSSRLWLGRSQEWRSKRLVTHICSYFSSLSLGYLLLSWIFSSSPVLSVSCFILVYSSTFSFFLMFIYLIPNCSGISSVLSFHLDIYFSLNPIYSVLSSVLLFSLFLHLCFILLAISFFLMFIYLIPNHRHLFFLSAPVLFSPSDIDLILLYLQLFCSFCMSCSSPSLLMSSFLSLHLL